MKRNDDEWNQLYAKGATPWDAGDADSNLEKIIDIIRQSHTAIDIGCGSGNEAIFMAKFGVSVLGIDLSQAAIASAIEKGEKARVSRYLEFRVQNFLTFDANVRFDFALDRRAFHFLDPAERGVYAEKLASLLMPKGHYMLIVSSEFEPGNNRYHFSEQQLVEVFGQYFDLLSIELVTIESHEEKPKSYVCVWQKK